MILQVWTLWRFPFQNKSFWLHFIKSKYGWCWNGIDPKKQKCCVLQFIEASYLIFLSFCEALLYWPFVSLSTQVTIQQSEQLWITCLIWLQLRVDGLKHLWLALYQKLQFELTNILIKMFELSSSLFGKRLSRLNSQAWMFVWPSFAMRTQSCSQSNPFFFISLSFYFWSLFFFSLIEYFSLHMLTSLLSYFLSGLM